MKFYTVFILVLLIAYINSDCDDENFTPSGKKDCKDKLSEVEKNGGNSYCCYLETKSGDKVCWALTKDEYNDIDNYIKEAEKDSEGNLKIKSLDCNSLFLKLGFMNILFFLL